METCDMTCWKCYYATQQEDDQMDLQLVEGAEGHPTHSVLCSLSPITVEIGRVVCGAPPIDMPHIYEDPHFHWCGSGRWHNQGAWEERFHAEDEIEDYIERHAFDYLKGDKL